jgi:hypothetical protein
MIGILKDAWKMLRQGAKAAVCHHYYCYRSLECTQCHKRHVGFTEPEFTPHISRNGKLIPARIVGDRLVPLEGFDAA